VEIPFDIQPVLEGKLVELRPLKDNDFGPLMLAASDPLIWEQHPAQDRYQRPIFENFFEDAIKSRGAFAVVDKETQKIIGTSRFCSFVPELKKIEVGFTFLKREYWGGTYNRELKTLMLNYIFQFVEEVEFKIGEKNLRSRRATEKFGAKLIEIVERTRHTGEVHSACIYLLKKSDWV
jgi:RimJ/RimL family protein N-acetyltransferase